MSAERHPNSADRRVGSSGSMGNAERRPEARPLYLQVRDFLASRIASQQWKPGLFLPSEIDLARELKVSPGTIRKALDLMTRQKIISRQQGRGTIVNDYQSEQAPRLFATIFDAMGSPIRETWRLKSMTRTYAGEHAPVLAICESEEVIKLERLRLNDGKCFMIETALLPAKFFAIFSEEMATRKLSAVAQRNGHVLGRATEEIDRLSQTLTGRVKELAERYAEPMPEIADEVDELTKQVERHLAKMGFSLK